MPFKSKAQQGYLEAKHPSLAKKFEAETPKGSYKGLPQHVQKKGKPKHDPVRKASAAYLKKSRQQPYKSNLPPPPPQQQAPAQSPGFLPDQYPVGS